MSDLLKLLPLSFVMIAGPQVISAVFLATSERWAQNSGAYLLGAAISITTIVTAAYLIAHGAKTSTSSSNQGSTNDLLDGIILALLLVAALYVFLKRKVSEPPKWMGKLTGATPRFSFTLGFLLLGVFPTDLAASVSVGIKTARDGQPWWHTLGLVVLTLFLLALPALLVLLMGQRAKMFLPKVRQWMNDNSWVVSELVIALFVVIEINSLLG